MTAELSSDPYDLSPEDISSHDFPVSMRGFDRDAVNRKLRNIANCYALAVRQRDRSRTLAQEATDRAIAAEGEARTSARSIAQLTTRASALDSELAEAQARIAELDAELERAMSEPAAPVEVADSRELERAQERIADLEKVVEQARAERTEALDRAAAVESKAATAHDEPEDAGELLVSAVRAADVLRATVREEAQRTLKKARERAADLERQAEHQRRALEQAQARAATLAADADRVKQELEHAQAERLEAQREAELVRDRVRAEAEHTLASLQQQRQRVQSLLGDALAALDEDTGDARGVLDDLAARLHPQATEPS